MAGPLTKLYLGFLVLSVFISLHAGQPLLFLILVLPGSVAWFYRGLKSYRFLQEIRNMPTSRIRSLSRGFVEVHGKVFPAQGVLVSPFTKKQCVYYRYIVEEYVSDGRKSAWVTVSSNYLYLNFYLRDGTGQVLVNLQGAEVDISPDYYSESGDIGSATESVQQYVLGSRMYSADMMRPDRSMRFTEYVIAPGDDLYVLGTAGENPFHQEGNDRVTAEELSKLPGSKMLSDDKARCKLEPPFGDGLNHIDKLMIQKGDGKMFFVSNKSEHVLDADLLSKALWGIYGGALVSVLSLGWILSIMGLI